MDFRGQDILSTKQFTREEIEYLLSVARYIEAHKERYVDLLRGKVVATLFFEPSTRTRLSFESAVHRLGGNVIGFSSAESSSSKKGETLADTIRTVSNYCDAIVMRHASDGAARLAARFSSVPVINAGSGAEEHPTQALLDLLAIQELSGRIDGLSVGLCGDLKYGRTVHSLAYLLTNYNVNLYLIAPDQLKMQYRVTEYLRRKQKLFKETPRFQATIPILDVLYMTRIQQERFPDPDEYERIRNIYVLNHELLQTMRQDAILLHPLPRVEEIHPECDADPRAKYFQQTYHGLMLRKALLALVLGEQFDVPEAYSRLI
jgi:aspartate carbamoyltransferase catalytic subunit